MTTSLAARVLRVTPDTLRRWVRDGRFKHVAGMEWKQVGLQRQRSFTREWIARVAAEIGIEPDFAAVEGTR